MSNNPQEAQTTETRAYIRNEIAALFHVPVRMVGDTGKSSRASTEQENQELLDYTLAPWLSAIKLEWKRKLFRNTGVGRTPVNRFFVDFDTSEMLRSDAASREKFYASGRQWSYLCPNDIRGFEKLNPIAEDWAERYIMPVNMTMSDTPIVPSTQDGAGNGSGKQPSAAGSSADSMPAVELHLERFYNSIFRDALGRFLAREKRNSEAFQLCFHAVLGAIRDACQADAERILNFKDAPIVESERFVDCYMAAMNKRAAAWSVETADKIVNEELLRATRAIRIAVYRECATAKAKGDKNDQA